MKPMILASLSVTVLCAGAAAQFDQFDWTLDNHGNLTSGLSPDSMWFSGSHSNLPGSLAIFTTSSPVAGRVSVNTYFWTEELECGSSNAYYLLNGHPVSFSNCSYFDPITLDVAEGESFGFGMLVNDPLWTADLNFTSFSFKPCWTPLGGALAGSAGLPALEGHGLLKANGPFSVDLSDAAPSQGVALVVGFSQLDLPFKGGVLVPSIDALLLGLVSDLNGELSLASTWPAGVPDGFEFFLQAWITDPAGPHGFAASNAVKGFAP